jgi:ankyrin repeat protein
MKIFTFLLLPLVILFHVIPNNCGLFKACYEGNLVAFNSLVQDHLVDTTKPDENGVTPLLAVFLGYKVAQKNGIETLRIRGYEKIIRILLDQDHNVFARSSRGTTLFMLAASTGSAELLKIMLRLINGSNEQFLLEQDIEGKTAFYHALENKHLVCMQTLEKWALVSDARFIKSGCDELMKAIALNDRDIINFVGRLPYRQFGCDQEGNNVFHYLALYGDPSGSIFQKFRIISSQARGLSELACTNEKLKKAICSGNKAFLTPMHLAVQRGNQECVEFFLAKAGDESIRVHDCLGLSPMHYLMIKRDISTLDLALIDFFIGYENKHNVAQKESLFNIRDTDGNTPCMHIVSNDCIEIVKYFRGKKVGLVAQNNMGENPFHIAVQNNSVSMVLALVDYFSSLSSGSLTDSAQGNVLSGLLLQKNKLHMTPLDLAGLQSFSDSLSACQKALSLSFKSV